MAKVTDADAPLADGAIAPLALELRDFVQASASVVGRA
jgi:hypothetical protein